MMRTSFMLMALLGALASRAAAQMATGPLTLTQAMALGRERGVSAALAGDRRYS